MKATESGIMQFLLLANFELKYLKSAYDNQKYEAMFLDIKKLAGQRFTHIGVLDFGNFTEPTKTFMYLHRSSAHLHSKDSPRLKLSITRETSLIHKKHTN